MGIVSVTKEPAQENSRCIPRLKGGLTMDYSTTNCGIQIHPYNLRTRQLGMNLLVSPLEELNFSNNYDPSYDLLWHCEWFFFFFSREAQAKLGRLYLTRKYMW